MPSLYLLLCYVRFQGILFLSRILFTSSFDIFKLFVPIPIHTQRTIFGPQVQFLGLEATCKTLQVDNVLRKPHLHKTKKNHNANQGRNRGKTKIVLFIYIIIIIMIPTSLHFDSS